GGGGKIAGQWVDLNLVFHLVLVVAHHCPPWLGLGCGVAVAAGYVPARVAPRPWCPMPASAGCTAPSDTARPPLPAPVSERCARSGAHRCTPTPQTRCAWA